jgi:hypothetical protein
MPTSSIAHVSNGEGRSFRVRLVKDKSDASAIYKAPRAIVFVDAPYSVYAAKNGQQFLSGMFYLTKSDPAVQPEVLWIEDDNAEWCKEWIVSLGVDGLREVAVPVGNGAILWMEYGKVVRFQLGHEIRSASEIKKTTLEVWKAEE